MSDATLAPDALETWQANAQEWDKAVGNNGNKYWTVVQEPCLERLLGSRLTAAKGGAQPCRALELTTGNGICARWLAAHGAEVVATDGSSNMLEHARARGDCGGRIDFAGTLDVTVESDFEPFIERGAAVARLTQSAKHDGYDIVLMNMSMHDVATIEPLASQLPKLLKKDGMFVAQMLHPVFMTSTYSRVFDVSYDPITGSRVLVQGKLIKEYLHVEPRKMLVIEDQVKPQLYFHRPIHEILGTFFKEGFVLDALEEPNFTEADVNDKRMESTCNFSQLPAIFTFRLRRAT